MPFNTPCVWIPILRKSGATTPLTSSYGESGKFSRVAEDDRGEHKPVDVHAPVGDVKP